MGGGRASFLPKNGSDPEARWDYDTYDWSHCNRLDGRNLIQEWINNTGGRYVENLEQLNTTLVLLRQSKFNSNEDMVLMQVRSPL